MAWIFLPADSGFYQLAGQLQPAAAPNAAPIPRICSSGQVSQTVNCDNPVDSIVFDARELSSGLGLDRIPVVPVLMVSTSHLD